MPEPEKGNEAYVRQTSAFNKLIFGTVQALLVLGVVASVDNRLATSSNSTSIEFLMVNMESFNRLHDVMDGKIEGNTKLMYQVARINGEQNVMLKHLREQILSCQANLERIR